MKPKPGAVEICILSGGLSRRMGRDKARLRLGGRSLLARVRAVAARTPHPLRVIRRDLVPRCGPLGGIYTALKTTQAEAVLFLACDMPFMTAEWINRLIGMNKGRVAAIFTLGGHGPGFPFLLRRAAMAQVEKQIAAAQFSLHELAAQCRARLLRAPVDAPFLFNVNTPDDLKKAKKKGLFCPAGGVRRKHDH